MQKAHWAAAANTCDVPGYLKFLRLTQEYQTCCQTSDEPVASVNRHFSLFGHTILLSVMSCLCKAECLVIVKLKNRYHTKMNVEQVFSLILRFENFTVPNRHI